MPLLAVAEVEYQQRIDRRRSAVISARLKGDIRHEIQEHLDENFYPDWKARYPGVAGEAEGEQQFIQEVT